MDQWAGRVALVTGASSGIGKAIALRLAQHKMKVVACGRNIERLRVSYKCQVGLFIYNKN